MDEGFEARVRNSFARQQAMETLGASLSVVKPGEVEIVLPFRTDLTQQHGFLHAGIVATVVDSACGYAAYSLMPADAAVLSVEFKINLLAPARGTHILACGRVTRAGRTITVCEGEAIAVNGDDRQVVAAMMATMLCVRGRPGLTG